MTRILKNITDSDLDLACGGTALFPTDLAQVTDARQRPDATSGDAGAAVPGSTA